MLHKNVAQRMCSEGHIGFTNSQKARTLSYILKIESVNILGKIDRLEILKLRTMRSLETQPQPYMQKKCIFSLFFPCIAG